MHSKFWSGLLWGGIIGVILSTMLCPMMRPRRKPMLERGTDAVVSTTKDLMKEARRARKNIMHKLS